MEKERKNANAKVKENLAAEANEKVAKEVDLSLLEEMEEIITPGSKGTSSCCNDSQW